MERDFTRASHSAPFYGCSPELNVVSHDREENTLRSEVAIERFIYLETRARSAGNLPPGAPLSADVDGPPHLVGDNRRPERNTRASTDLAALRSRLEARKECCYSHVQI